MSELRFSEQGIDSSFVTLADHVDALLLEDSPAGEAMRKEVRNGADELELTARGLMKLKGEA